MTKLTAGRGVIARELFHELNRVEDQMGRPIAPRRLELDEDAPVGPEPHAVSGQRASWVTDGMDISRHASFALGSVGGPGKAHDRRREEASETGWEEGRPFSTDEIRLRAYDRYMERQTLDDDEIADWLAAAVRAAPTAPRYSATSAA